MNYIKILEKALKKGLTKRQYKIYSLLVSGKCSIKKLPKKLIISRTTIWRDLKILKKVLIKILEEDL